MTKLRVAYVLTQCEFGPTDVAVALTRWCREQPDVEVQLFAPPPKKHLEQIRDVWTRVDVGRKGDRRSMARARRAIEDFAPDVIHAQDRRSGLVIAPFALRPVGHRPSLVLTYHGAPEGVPNEWAFSDGTQRPGRYQAAVLAADAVIGRMLDATVVVSPDMARFLTRRLRMPARRVHHVDNGLFLGDPAAVRLPGGARRFLFIGSLIERKGVSDLLEAFAVARVSHPGIMLTIAGDGPLRESLEAKAHALHISEGVEFLGFRQDTMHLLSTHDCLVLPSFLEQQPLVLIEAMGAGRGIVATDVGGVREMCPDDSAATVLVEPGEVAGLARAMQDVAETPDFAEGAARNLAWAHERFSIEITGRAHLQLYAELLERSKRR